jgi:hypothetical protein
LIVAQRRRRDTLFSWRHRADAFSAQVPSTSPPGPLSITMERESDLQESQMLVERHGIPDESPLTA